MPAPQPTPITPEVMTLPRRAAAAEGVRVGKISGSVGTFAHTPPEVERIACERLGLEPSPITGAEGNREFLILLGPIRDV